MVRDRKPPFNPDGRVGSRYVMVTKKMAGYRIPKSMPGMMIVFVLIFSNIACHPLTLSGILSTSRTDTVYIITPGKSEQREEYAQYCREGQILKCPIQGKQQAGCKSGREMGEILVHARFEPGYESGTTHSKEPGKIGDYRLPPGMGITGMHFFCSRARCYQQDRYD
jgi:hypothetical protein